VDAIGDFIRPHLDELSAFADYLNTEPTPPRGRPAPDSPLADAWAETEANHQERFRAWQIAREIAERATGRSPFDPLPLEAVASFQELASQTPIHYRLWRYAEDITEARAMRERAEQGHSPLRHYQTAYRLTRDRGPGRSRVVLELGLESDSATLGAVAGLARFLVNPHRGRLRRCQRCARWFVDATRNKSQQRCSRACTIVWSNSQRPRRKRPKKGAPR
jgi:hypothetical protein